MKYSLHIERGGGGKNRKVRKINRFWAYQIQNTEKKNCECIANLLT